MTLPLLAHSSRDRGTGLTSGESSINLWHDKLKLGGCLAIAKAHRDLGITKFLLYDAMRAINVEKGCICQFKKNQTVLLVKTEIRAYHAYLLYGRDHVFARRSETRRSRRQQESSATFVGDLWASCSPPLPWECRLSSS